ncbi:MAG TPA: serine/threonine-protein kinase [Polyangiaceae bacterium]|nr:serine/threonine-protein kinase [Polyangiaceae bacterium]
MVLGVGDVVDHRYRLVERLGAGGQAEVWRAEDLRKGHRTVALKVVALDDGNFPAIERVRREGRLLHRLRHPSLIRCHAQFEDLAISALVLELDYVDASPLSDLLSDSRLSPTRREQVLQHVASALRYLHQEGIVHRDLKPANILIARRFFDEDDPQWVKVVDFGIAAQPKQDRLTAAGRLIGTAPYMAPEQLEPRFWEAREGDLSASDIFSFGCMAHELLVGRHPTGLSDSATEAEFAAQYRTFQGRSLIQNPPLREPWATTLTRCLLVEASKRIRDGAALVDALTLQGKRPRETQEAIGPLPGVNRTRRKSSTASPDTDEPVSVPARPTPFRGRMVSMALVGLVIGTVVATIDRSSNPSSGASQGSGPRAIPAGTTPNGTFVPSFSYLSVTDAPAAKFGEAVQRCRALQLQLCTAPQWERTCGSTPALGKRWSWVLAVNSSDPFLIQRGGDSCASARSVPTSERADSGMLCCSRAIASNEPDDSLDVLHRFENQPPGSDRASVLRSILAPHLEQYYANLHDVDREEAIRATLKYPGEPGDGSSVHDNCVLVRQADSISMVCQHYLVSPKTLSVFSSEYTFRNGLISSVRDRRPTLELQLVE